MTTNDQRNPLKPKFLDRPINGADRRYSRVTDSDVPDGFRRSADGVILPAGVYSLKETSEYEQVRRNEFFLLKNLADSGVGPTRCEGLKDQNGKVVYPGCNGFHKYFTLRCVDRPFNGLANVLYAYTRVADPKTPVPPQLARFGNWAAKNPETARRLGLLPDNEFTNGVCAFIISFATPITTAEALRLQSKVNGKGLNPPLNVVDEELIYGQGQGVRLRRPSGLVPLREQGLPAGRRDPDHSGSGGGPVGSQVLRDQRLGRATGGRGDTRWTN